MTSTKSSADSSFTTPGRNRFVLDSIVIFTVVLISSLPYLSGLGFYADDWTYEAELSKASVRGIGAMVQYLLTDDGVRVRPMHLVYLVSSVKLFGTNPLPFHVLDILVLGVTAVSLYSACLAIGAGRWTGLALSLLFGLAPHYSTDRIWTSLQQARLCMLFAFLGIIALSKAMNANTRCRWPWFLGTLAAFMLSLLSYEVAIGLIVGAVLYTGWQAYHGRRNETRSGIGSIVGLAGMTLVLFAFGITKMLKQTKISYHHHLFSHIGAVAKHAVLQAFTFNLWTYGLHIPWAVGQMWSRSAISGTALVCAVAITLLAAIYLWRCTAPNEIPAPRKFPAMLGIGFVIFALGYGLFFSNLHWDFTSTGVANRVAIASTVGAACVMAAVIGLLGALAPAGKWRLRVTSVVLAVMCGLNSLVVSGIASYWVSAAQQQSQILQSVRRNVQLPQGGMLLLDGFCRMIGPGVTFIAAYDTSSALQLTLKEPSVTGGVISPDTSFSNAGADVSVFGGLDQHFPYGDKLFLYQVPRNLLVPLRSKADVDRYLKTKQTAAPDPCTSLNSADAETLF